MNFFRNILFSLTCVYIIVLPLIPQEIKFKGVSLTDLILGLIMFVFLLYVAVLKKGRDNFINSVMDFLSQRVSLFITILLGIMVTSTIYSMDKKLALSESLRFATYVVMYFIIKYEFNNKKQINVLLKSYIFGSFALSCIGIVQYFTGFALDETFKRTYEFGGSIRITSTFSNPNAYGAYLILIIFPAIMLSIYEKNKTKKIAYISLSILLLTNLLMTFSRNALLGFGLGLVVLSLIYSIKLIFALGGFGVLIFFIPPVFKRIIGIFNLAQNELRIKLWKTALMMIKEHPILGVGNGNFVVRYNEYVSKYKELKYYSYQNYPSHNSYLKVQSELGLIGIVSFLGVAIISLIRIKKLYSTTTDNFHKAFYIGVMSSMAAFLFMNLFDNLFFVPKVTMYFWFLLATVEALLNNGHKENIK